MKKRLPLFIAGWLTMSLATAGPPVAGGAPQSGTTVTPGAVISQYCTGCHNDRLKSGDLALTAIDVDNAGANPQVWEKVVRKLRGRMMPPPGRPRPDEKTYDQVVGYLEQSLDRASAA